MPFKAHLLFDLRFDELTAYQVGKQRSRLASRTLMAAMITAHDFDRGDRFQVGEGDGRVYARDSFRLLRLSALAMISDLRDY